MISYLADINVWLAMSWARHPHYQTASRWYESIGNSELLFCRFTMLGFLRLLTNEKVMGENTVKLDGALDLFDRWCQDPRVELISEPSGIEPLLRLAMAPFGSQTATKAIADCYLVSFAEAVGATVVTLDRGLSSTAQLRKVRATLLKK